MARKIESKRPTSAKATATLASLIQAHRSAAAAHDAACDRFNECDLADASIKSARLNMAAACKADDEALMAVCSYRCASMAEVEQRAAYLRTTRMFDECVPVHEFVDALLNSMVPADVLAQRQRDSAAAR